MTPHFTFDFFRQLKPDISLPASPPRSFLPPMNNLPGIGFRGREGDVIIQTFHGFGFQFGFFQAESRELFDGRISTKDRGALLMYGISGNVNFGFTGLEMAVHALPQTQVGFPLEPGRHRFFLSRGIHRFYYVFLSEPLMDLYEAEMPRLAELREPPNERPLNQELLFFVYSQRDTNVFTRLGHSVATHWAQHELYNTGVYRLICMIHDRIANRSGPLFHGEWLLYENAIKSIRKRYMDRDFDKTTLARELGISLSTLKKVFWKRPQGIYEMINSLRMEQARELLYSSDLPISEIGTLVGCHDQSHFTKLFKKTFAMTPGECRSGVS